MTDAEDAAITRAAETDPDNPPLTDQQLGQMRPAREVLTEVLGKERADAVLKRHVAAHHPLLGYIQLPPGESRSSTFYVDPLVQVRDFVRCFGRLLHGYPTRRRVERVWFDVRGFK